MCGRYTQTTTDEELRQRFQPDDLFGPILPSYNIAPTQMAPVVLMREGRRVLLPCRWGLVPSWAKDVSIGNRLINARAETVGEKPAFRAAYHRRRCLVPADGFYEWRKDGRVKTPFYAGLKGHNLFAFAGLWEAHKSPDGSMLTTFTILTTDANAVMAPIHDRMPVILPPDREAAWLDERTPADVLAAMVGPYPDDAMTAYPVSTRVNKPAYNRPDCIEPAEDDLFA